MGALVIPAIVLGLVLAAACVVSALKGKWGFALLSVWAVLPAAIRIAKPGSWWARRYYGPAKLALARERFPVEDAIALESAAELATAWDGVDEHDVDRITRRALRKARR